MSTTAEFDNGHVTYAPKRYAEPVEPMRLSTVAFQALRTFGHDAVLHALSRLVFLDVCTKNEAQAIWERSGFTGHLEVSGGSKIEVSL